MKTKSNMTDNREIKIKHLFKSACGYGLKEEAFTECLMSIPDKYFDDFIYTLYRIAEKRGSEGFEL